MLIDQTSLSHASPGSTKIWSCKLALQCRDRGFTLIEVLIALIVLSLGLLGLIALQTRSLAASHSAYLTSVASIQAMSLAEMMRANPKAADVYHDANLDEIGPPAPLKQCEGSNYCTPAALANYDLARWAADTRDKSPSTLSMDLKTTTVSSNQQYRLELSWETPTDDKPQQFLYVFLIGNG